ncbi:MAG: ORF6N domain-containing protein [Candidatus Nitrotoga sp. LAW]|nr:MAG: ORF6N domain-containing protein [Candidatus Nitrotoga sp. LAW]
MTPVSTLIAPESISRQTLLIQGHKVMLDADFAYLYGVPTKALNQDVRWNLESFPSDFMYQLTAEEKQEALERKISSHGQAITGLIDVMRQLMQAPAGSLCPIGFMTDISKLRSK